MTKVHFKRSQKRLGSMGQSIVSVAPGAAPADADFRILLFKQGKATHDFADEVDRFILRCQMIGAAGGSVTVEPRTDAGPLPPFHRKIRSDETNAMIVESQLEPL